MSVTRSPDTGRGMGSPGQPGSTSGSGSGTGWQPRVALEGPSGDGLLELVDQAAYHLEARPPEPDRAQIDPEACGERRRVLQAGRRQHRVVLTPERLRVLSV